MLEPSSGTATTREFRACRGSPRPYAVDELTGLITATALVHLAQRHEVDALGAEEDEGQGLRPRGEPRGRRRGAADLGVDLDEHIDFVIGAMRGSAEALGLAGSPATG